MGKCQSCGREKLNINLLQGKDRPVLHFQYPNAYLPLMAYYDNRKKGNEWSSRVNPSPVSKAVPVYESHSSDRKECECDPYSV